MYDILKKDFISLFYKLLTHYAGMDDMLLKFDNS